MNKHEASTQITKYLESDGLQKYFTQDIHHLLSENLRKTRIGNTKKYGKIDHFKTPSGRVHFSKGVIESLYVNKIKPIALANEKASMEEGKITLLH